MKKIVLILVTVILMSSFVFAQGAAYNLGTMQKDKVIEVEPGKSATTKIYFYNIFGNRITHVKLNVEEAPEGWGIEINPELHNVTLNVTGVIIHVEENLYTIPCSMDKDWCPTNDTTPREGVEYLTASGVDGKVPAKYVTITVHAPSGTPLWKEYPLKITATANWYGEAGMVALSQQRDFDYTIKTVMKEYTEQIVEEKKGNNWICIGVLIGIVVITLIILLIKKRKTKSWKKRKY
ncbi:MAG: hypothetical protein J7K87_02025 [Candidatus Aenigmarchaeota archaeon]|nr:hypothetical protein [Candidatus Aenigmarchaeota archaeon]